MHCSVSAQSSYCCLSEYNFYLSKMSNENPLQVCFSSSKEKQCNRSGRPTMANMIKFGPQPRSIIISQILNERRTGDLATNDKVSSFNDNSEDPLESAYSAVVQQGSQNICSVCSNKSCNLKEHKKHLIETNQHNCNYPNCTYSCKISSNLIKHKRVHTNQKPYLCEKCCFRTNFVNSLKVHRRTHTAERPYMCAHCSYKCNSSSNLKKHFKHRHQVSTT